MPSIFSSSAESSDPAGARAGAPLPPAKPRPLRIEKSGESSIQGSGEMAERVRTRDWGNTPLGALNTWSEALVMAVNVMLLSPSASALYWGADRTLLYNDGYRPFLAEKHPEALGSPGTEVWAEAWPVIGPAIEGAYRDGAVTHVRQQLIPVLVDGQLQDRWWSYGFYPIYEAGRIAAVANTGTEDTAQMLAEQALRASEAQATRVLLSIGDAVIVTDEATRIRQMNPVAEALTGWSESEAQGRQITEVMQIVHEETRERVKSPAEQARRTREPAELGTRTMLLARDGRAFAIEENASPICSQTGELTGVVLVFRDVTQRRRDQRAVEIAAKAQRFLLALTDAQSEATGAREVMRLAAQALGEHLRAGRVGFWEAPTASDGATGSDTPGHGLTGYGLTGHGIALEAAWCQDRVEATGPMFGHAAADTAAETAEQVAARPMLRLLASREVTAGLAAGRALVCPDVRSLPGFAGETALAGAVVAVPMVRNGVWRRSVYVQQEVPREWTEQQVALVAEVARRTAEAIERAQSEEAFRRSESHLRLVVEAADLGSWFYDPEADVLGGDAKIDELFGTPEARKSVEGWLACLHEDDRSRVRAEFAAALEGAPYDTAYRVVQPNGTCVWVRAKAQMLDADGASRLVGVCEDITARKRVEEELRGLAERLRMAQATGKIASWDWDVESDAVIWDEGVALTYGRPPSEMSSMRQIFSYIHEEDRERVWAELRSAQKGLGEYRSTFRTVWPDGTMRSIEAYGKTIFAGESGERAARVVGVNLDVTERHQAEEALIRTEKLAAVGRLAASIAHEINNPLESVTNLLYLMRGNKDIDQVHRYTETAERELRRVSLIANQTLRFHRQSSRPGPFYCHDMIDDTLSMFQGRLVNSHIAVEKRKRAERAVMCLGGEIRQVIANLVGNAIDAMPLGGRLLVRSREAFHWKLGGRGLVITVADTGTGIGQAAQKRIFEPFFTTKGIGGTGLGLWISSEIVSRHHGELRLRTSQREGASGTVFTMFLPYGAGADGSALTD
jgi:PAS domain S-box-containing protein